MGVDFTQYECVKISISCFIFREKEKFKEKEEVWCRIELAAKNNPHYPAVAPLINGMFHLSLSDNSQDEFDDDITSDFPEQEAKEVTLCLSIPSKLV